MKNKVITVFALLTIILACYFLFSRPNIAQGTYIYADPPVNGRIELVGDYIYFVQEYGIVSKYSKDTLAEVGTTSIQDCYNLRYSDYLDRIIVIAGQDPCKLIYLNPATMLTTDEIIFGGQIADIATSGDNLYAVWDNSGIIEGETYDPFNLPSYTGVLTEIDLNTGINNWDVSIGTHPKQVDIAGEYAIIKAEEVIQYPDADDYNFMYGGIINIVNLNSLRVRESYVAHRTYAGVEYDGDNTLFITSPDWTPGHRGPDSGMTSIYLDTLDWTHLYFNAPVEVKYGWSAGSCDLVGAELYIAYSNSGAIPDETHFGKYNIGTETLENITIQGINVFFNYLVVDGDDIYFVTDEGGLLKYTMD